MVVEDDKSVYNSIFLLMAKFDDEKDSNEVTLSELKYDLDNLPAENLRKLAVLLIDYVDKRTTENLILNEKLSLCKDENVAILAHVSEMSARIGMFESSNVSLEEDSRTSKNDKRKLSVFEEELEDKLKIFETKLAASLETNSQPINDLSNIKEELIHSLKWTDSSRTLFELSQQSFNGKKGLGCGTIKPPLNPHRKYLFVDDNLLCTHSGRNDHLKITVIS